jgi:hypothetical protein
MKSRLSTTWRPGTFVLLFAPLLASGCQQRSSGDAAASTSTPADSSVVAEAASWQELFDGTSLAGWQGHRTPGVVPAGWTVEKGVLLRSGAGGDLVTAAQYANFELEFEWMVTAGGNSGVFYRINPDVEVTYMSAPEYQVLDDALHRDGQSRLTSAGAAYGLYPSPEGHTKPVGEWNQGRIVVDGAKVEHWLNGTLTASYELWSPDWEQRVRDSKFKEWPQYGRATRGHIGLQDHGDRVGFRNIRIKVLP